MNNNDAQSRRGEVRGTLACERCGKDLLDGADGVFVFVSETREFVLYPRYAAVYWWCKTPCQGEAMADLGLERWTTHWKSVDDAANPLEYLRWNAETSRLIERGSFSTPAAKKLSEAKLAVARVTARKPTAEDIARYRQIRMMHGP